VDVDEPDRTSHDHVEQFHAIVRDSSPNFNPPGPPPVMIPGTPTAHFSYTFNVEGTYVYFCKLHRTRSASPSRDDWARSTSSPGPARTPLNAAVSGASMVGYGPWASRSSRSSSRVFSVVRKKGPSGGMPPQT